MTIERCDALCSNSGVWRGELMVFIIMSPFPFHFLYKLAQVPRCVPERAHQRQPAEMHLQTHCSGVLLSLLTQVSPSFAFLQPTYSSSPFCLLHLHFTVLLAFPYFHFCITLFLFPVPLFLFPFFFPTFLYIVSCLVFLTKHYPTTTLRISLLFYKLWIIQGHISLRLIKTQHEIEPRREGNRECDVFRFLWLK